MRTSSGAKHWSSLREAGTYRGLMLLLWIYRRFGRGAYSVVLWPVAWYFTLCRPSARRASRDFLRTHYRCRPDMWSRPPRLMDVARHFYSFGQCILDKLLGWVAPIAEAEFELCDPARIEALVNNPRGQLIIGTHLGNLEYCRGFMQRYKGRTVNVLVYDRHAANFVRMMQQVHAQSRLNVFQVDELDIPTLLRLREKVLAGEWVFIAGDRVPVTGDRRTAPVTFMGRQALLPIGPYMLAHSLQCEVKLMFSYRMGAKVRFELVPFCEGVELPRRQRDEALRAYAQQFAVELERQCLRAPLQWFNFFPFWTDGNSPQTVESCPNERVTH